MIVRKPIDINVVIELYRSRMTAWTRSDGLIELLIDGQWGYSAVVITFLHFGEGICQLTHAPHHIYTNKSCATVFEYRVFRHKCKLIHR